MGASCTAGISLRAINGNFEVIYYATHVGHKPDENKDFTPLTEEEKIELRNAGKCFVGLYYQQFTFITP